MSMIAVAVIGGVAAVAGGVIAADASRKAANTQADAARRGQDLTQEQFAQTQANLAPWMKGGGQGLNALLGYLGISDKGYDPNAPGVRPFNMSDMYADPGYQFTLKEGQNALINRASAGGGVWGGNTGKALAQYTTDLANTHSNEAFNRYRLNQNDVYSRLNALSNTGANTAGGVAGLGADAANTMAQLGLIGGRADAAGTLGQANAWNTGIDNVGKVGSNWYYANQQQQNNALANNYASAGGNADYMSYLQAQAAAGG